MTTTSRPGSCSSSRADDTRRDEVTAVVDSALPELFEGRPTQVSVTTIRDYVRDLLGLDPGLDLATGLTARDWLALPEQGLVMLTSGEVFHDDIGLERLRDRLAYYPRDVWLFLMAAAWWQLHPEGNLVGRIGHVGDELGSAVLGARLVESAMRLAFLMERTYAPYVKWFGTAFSRLSCAGDLTPALTRVLRADRWPEREAALAEVYLLLGARHDRLGVTAPVPMEDVRMWDRPFAVPWGDFPEALLAQVSDPRSARSPRRGRSVASTACVTSSGRRPRGPPSCASWSDTPRDLDVWRLPRGPVPGWRDPRRRSQETLVTSIVVAMIVIVALAAAVVVYVAYPAPR